MKKQLLQRGLLGFPLGIAIGYVITIIISVGWGQGSYFAVTPELWQMMGNELNAVVLQTVLCGLMGTGFAMASLIWERENWSIAKQSGLYFAVIAAIMLPIAYFANWMQHSLVGFLFYLGIFVLVFFCAWIFQYLGWKAKVQRINEKMKSQAGRK